MMEPSRNQKYGKLTLNMKMDILEKIDRGVSFTEVSKMFNIPRSSIYDLNKNRNKLEKFARISCPGIRCRRTLKSDQYPQLEKALYSWFLQERERHTPITDDILRQKALFLYKKIYKKTDFMASEGWLNKFKTRFHISNPAITRKKLCDVSEDIQQLKRHETLLPTTITEEKLHDIQPISEDNRQHRRRSVLLPNDTHNHLQNNSFSMREQEEQLKVYDLLPATDAEDQLKRHGVHLPNDIRSLIVGSSGCGKTNLLMTLIFEPNALRFMNIYVYSRSLIQSKYQYLKDVMGETKEIGYHTFEDSQNVISPQEAIPNSIVIFDDVAMENQNRIREYFSMGRHKALDCFYLSQTYAQIPKHLIRDNANFIILFKQDDLNLKHAYDDHVSSPDMPFTKFKQMCFLCWREPYGFIVVDKTRENDTGRYRKGFDTFIIV